MIKNYTKSGGANLALGMYLRGEEKLKNLQIEGPGMKESFTGQGGLVSTDKKARSSSCLENQQAISGC